MRGDAEEPIRLFVGDHVRAVLDHDVLGDRNRIDELLRRDGRRRPVERAAQDEQGFENDCSSLRRSVSPYSPPAAK